MILTGIAVNKAKQDARLTRLAGVESEHYFTSGIPWQTTTSRAGRHSRPGSFSNKMVIAGVSREERRGNPANRPSGDEEGQCLSSCQNTMELPCGCQFVRPEKHPPPRELFGQAHPPMPKPQPTPPPASAASVLTLIGVRQRSSAISPSAKAAWFIPSSGRCGRITWIAQSFLSYRRQSSVPMSMDNLAELFAWLLTFSFHEGDPLNRLAAGVACSQTSVRVAQSTLVDEPPAGIAC